MSATIRLAGRDDTKSVVPFGDGTHHQFSHSDLKHIEDPTGISTEEGEFLYGLVRMIRPDKCLETGTNIGVSASYIGLALQDNDYGSLVTIEHSPHVAEIARKKLEKMWLSRVTVMNCEVSEYSPPLTIDFLWLDTELDQRFAELLRFFPFMNEGAIACIHDIWEMDYDAFGGIPPELIHLFKTGQLRGMTFKTPHGVTVLQKRRSHDALADLFK